MNAVVDQSRQVLQAHARSFSWAAAFLPRDRARRAAVLYALCRLVDDTVDEGASPDEAAPALDRLEAEIRGEVPARPLVAAWSEAPDAHPAAMLALLDGVRTDLDPRPFDGDRELLRYCYGVAGTVGLAMCPILGVTGAAAQAHAIDLGIAMQLTNICRDVAEDARNGRVYLPVSRLRAHGTSAAALLSGEADPAAVSRVVLELLDLAEDAYASGEQGLRFIPWRTRVAIAVASRIYGAIGGVLRRRGGDALAGRAVVSTAGKVRATLAALAALPRLGWARYGGHAAHRHRHLAGLPGAAVALPAIPEVA